MLSPKNYKFIPFIVLGFLVLTPLLTSAEGAESFLQDTLWKAVNGIFGTILALCAWLFDEAINNYVIGFADEYTTSGIGIAIDQGWSLVRDIMNMVFIFGLLYIGFKIILNSDESSTRSLLVNLIVAALLVNFSLFITKFVVDVSNGLASQIAISGFLEDADPDTVTRADGSTYKRYQVDMSEDLTARMGLSSVYNYQQDQAQNEWGYIFGTAILFIVASFVFAAGAFLLIIRFVVLNLYILFSPIMFIGWAFPPLARYTKEYWKGFLGRAFFAPVYLLLIYFSVSIITALNENRGITNFSSDTLGNALQDPSRGRATLDEASAFPYFVVAIVSLLVSLFAAQKLGANGATAAINVGNKMRNYAQTKVKRGAVGTARFANRQTTGRAVRGAGRLASSAETRLNRQLGSLAQGGSASRAAARFLDRTAGAGLRGTQNASVSGSESFAGRQSRVDSQNSRLNQQAYEGARVNAIAEQRENYNNADTSTPEGREARRDAANAIGFQMRFLSDQEAVDIARNDRELLESPEFVQHLSDSHMNAIRESGVMTNADHQELGNLRNQALINETTVAFGEATSTAEELNSSFTQLGQTIRNMSADRKAGLGAGTLQSEEVAIHLTDRDIEQLEQSGRFNASDIQNIRNARDLAQTNIANGTHPAAFTVPGAASNEFLETQRRNMMRDSRQAGQMSTEVFADANMAEHLNPEVVAQRLRNGVSETERNAIRDNVDQFIASAPNEAERNRRASMWSNAARGGANSSFIAGLGLQNAQAGNRSSQNQAAAPSPAESRQERQQAMRDRAQNYRNQNPRG